MSRGAFRRWRGSQCSRCSASNYTRGTEIVRCLLNSYQIKLSWKCRQTMWRSTIQPPIHPTPPHSSIRRYNSSTPCSSSTAQFLLIHLRILSYLLPLAYLQALSLSSSFPPCISLYHFLLTGSRSCLFLLLPSFFLFTWSNLWSSVSLSLSNPLPALLSPKLRPVCYSVAYVSLPLPELCFHHHSAFVLLLCHLPLSSHDNLCFISSLSLSASRTLSFFIILFKGHIWREGDCTDYSAGRSRRNT